MVEFIDCLIYLAVTSFGGFLTGRVLPKNFIDENSPIFNSFGFEKGGAIYEKLRIREWKDKLPDMSRIFTKTMPSKRLYGAKDTYEKMAVLVKETCVAEIIHVFLCIMALRCMKIWRRTGGFVVAVLYITGNIPFIMIQRYNRPRLKSVLEKKRRLKTI